MISMLPEPLPITKGGIQYMLIGVREDDDHNYLRGLVSDADGELMMVELEWPSAISDWRFDFEKDEWSLLESSTHRVPESTADEEMTQRPANWSSEPMG